MSSEVSSIFLMRHGRPESSTAPDRAVPERELARIREMWEGIPIDEDVDIEIWSSPLRRAFQTAEVVCQVLGKQSSEIRVVNELARPDASSLLRELRDKRLVTRVLVGHQDPLEGLAHDLAGRLTIISYGEVLRFEAGQHGPFALKERYRP